MFSRARSYRSLVSDSLGYSSSNISFCNNSQLCSPGTNSNIKHKSMSSSSESSGARAILPSMRPVSVHPWSGGWEGEHAYDDSAGMTAGFESYGSWLMRLPIWLKSLAVGAVLLLTFSVIFVSVAAVLTANLNEAAGVNANTAGTDKNDSFGGNGYITSQSPSMSPAPSYSASLRPSKSIFTSVPITESSFPPTSSYTQEHGVPFTQPSVGPSTRTQIALKTFRPSFIGSNQPSHRPTHAQSPKPSITASYIPTVYPSYSPTEFQSPIPSISTSTTATPSATPSVIIQHTTSSKPSQLPSSIPPSPSSTTTSTFYVIGDRIKNQGNGNDIDRSDLNLNTTLSPSQGDFLVHLGDFNNLRAGCMESSYNSFQLQLLQSPVPVFVTPGDNEWNDCPNPRNARLFWKKYLTYALDEYFCCTDDDDADSFSVSKQRLHALHPHTTSSRTTATIRFAIYLHMIRQPGYEENFAFSLHSVLYVGVNLVGGSVLDDEEWSQRSQANLVWIQTQTKLCLGRMLQQEEKGKQQHEQLRALVIFGHSSRREEYRSFFRSLGQFVETLGIPTLYIHESNNNIRSSLKARALGKPNFWIAQVEGGLIGDQVTRVTVDTTGTTKEPFQLEGL